MKIMKSNNFIVTVLLLGLFTSCDYLDFDETNALKTKEEIYNYFNTTEQMLTNVYSYMPQDLGCIANAMRDCGCDDAEFGAVEATVQDFNNGNWSSLNTIDNSWTLYKGVRAANNFIADIENVDFSRFEYDARYKNWMRKLAYFPYEARVLRAFYFFELARRYGDIAMPLEVLTPEEANQIGKTPFMDVIEFIVKECDEAAKHLPDSYINEPDKQLGRITKGFAMAVKSKALLYAASALHNPTKDVQLWKRSAQAALDIINTNLYTLEKGTKANNVKSKEVVLMRMNGENTNFELYNFPIRFVQGKRPTTRLAHSTFPSQNLVDAFETKNGYPVTLTENGWVCDDPDFNPQKPYDNRDPRFYHAILGNGMYFKESHIETFEGGADNKSVSEGGTPTGYFLNKYIQPSTSFVPNAEVKNKHHWIIYRYAETLLTYAESMVNAFNDFNYTDNNFTHSAKWAIDEVRTTAGMPEITAATTEEFLKKLYNEWRIEFAFEDHRFWDVRRWKLAEGTQQKLYGVNITKSGELLNFSKKLVEERVWRNCMYLYPIPQDELFKNRNLYPQNPEW